MGPLDGIRVLDLSRFLAGPLCGMLLADMGAEVIRIEEPEGGPDRNWGQLGPDGETLSFKLTARNKKGISLRLTTKEGKGIFNELVRKSDVALHNFPPGTSISEALGYDNLKKTNEKIIVAALSGYGQNGPYAKQACFDATAQAKSEGMLVTGFPGDPPLKTSITYIDISTGQSTALGIMLALYHREKTGLGQEVDVSLFDTAFFAAQSLGVLVLYHVYGELRIQVANCGFHSYIGCLKAKNGWILIVPATDPIWKRFVKAIGREEMVDDPRFMSDMDRFRNAELIEPIVGEWVAQRTVEEATEALEKLKVPCSVVNTVDKLVNDPQVTARDMIQMADHPGLGEIPLPGVYISSPELPEASDLWHQKSVSITKRSIPDF
ncbi:MAG: CoA transferase [Desulfatiglandales bacterium]|nr:CoA transferase [Desulfatiglandales bacterium]